MAHVLAVIYHGEPLYLAAQVVLDDQGRHGALAAGRVAWRPLAREPGGVRSPGGPQRSQQQVYRHGHRARPRWCRDPWRRRAMLGLTAAWPYVTE